MRLAILTALISAAVLVLGQVFELEGIPWHQGSNAFGKQCKGWTVAMETHALNDIGRPDPYGNTEHRRIMLTIYYPITWCNCMAGGHRYLPKSVRDFYGKYWLENTLGFDPADASRFLQDLSIQTCTTELGLRKAEYRRSHTYPIIFVSPEFGASRLLYQYQAKNAARHGYVVILMDSPGETGIVEFPDGDTIYGLNTTDADPETMPFHLDVRTDDISFVVNMLQETEPAKTVFSLDSICNTDFIWIVGHGLGGATAAQMIHKDDRFRGGISLNGAPIGEVAEVGIHKPFLLVSAEDTPNIFGEFYHKIFAKFKMHISVKGTKHWDFSDLSYILLQRRRVAWSWSPADESRSEKETNIDAAFGKTCGYKLHLLQDAFYHSMGDYLGGHGSRRMYTILNDHRKYTTVVESEQTIPKFPKDEIHRHP